MQRNSGGAVERQAIYTNVAAAFLKKYSHFKNLDKSYNALPRGTPL